MLSMKVKSPAVLEFVTLPCLRIFNHLLQPEVPSSKKHKGKGVGALCTVSTDKPKLTVDVKRFLAADPRASYTQWKTNTPLKRKLLTAAILVLELLCTILKSCFLC